MGLRFSRRQPGSGKRNQGERVQEFSEFEGVLNTQGIYPALRYLNARTPHRFSGIYRFDDALLTNLYLVDKFDPDLRSSTPAPIDQTYCAYLREEPEIDFTHVEDTPYRASEHVVCYCGVLLRDPTGQPFGSICHFDHKRCQPRISDLPLLRLAGPLLYAAIRLESS